MKLELTQKKRQWRSLKAFKEKSQTEGYEVVSHTATLKEKKSKGEVIDSYYIVKIVMRW